MEGSAMKICKFWSLFLALSILMTTITGCSFLNKTFSYRFRQDRSNIEKVEICAYDHDSGKWTPITQLQDEHVDALLAELSALECGVYLPLDTILSYGDKVILITYSDGEVEMIGKYNIGWLSFEGELHSTNYYFVDLLEIREIIERYALY
jgi:hypothetical protein